MTVKFNNKMLRKTITIWADIFVYVSWTGIWPREHLDMLNPTPKKQRGKGTR